MENAIFFDYDSVFSSRLRSLIEEKNISKQKLADEIGVSRQAISQYCDGSTVPNADKLLKIAEYFNVSLDYLVGNTESKTPINTDEGQLIRSICDYTGLSEDAIFTLAHYSHSKCIQDFDCVAAFDFLNFLLDFDTQGIFLCESAGKIKVTIEQSTAHLIKARTEELDLIKDKEEPEKKEYVEIIEPVAKRSCSHEIGYCKYEAEKAFGYLIDDYIKNEQERFTEEMNIKWQP